MFYFTFESFCPEYNERMEEIARHALFHLHCSHVLTTGEMRTVLTLAPL